uniref:ZP domain-containing protein n=1 Tax=Ciona savignyi TaxID=51511 RepID=H2ZM45_CIOSA
MQGSFHIGLLLLGKPPKPILQEEEGTLKWIDDQQTLGSFAPWMVQEPDSGKTDGNGAGERHDCVKMTIMVVGSRSIANWYDAVCASREAFVCETEPIVPTSATVQPIQDVEIESTSMPTNLIFETSDTPMEYVENENDTEILNETALPLTVVGYGSGVDSNSTHDNTNTSSEPDLTESENFTSGEMETPSPTYTRRTCQLECSPFMMKAACPLANFPLMLDATAVLNNASCRPRRNSTHLIVHITLDGCGTMAKNIRGNEVSFSNTIRLASRGSILRSHQEISESTEFMVLDCRYPQRHMLMQNFRPAENRPRIHVTVQDGPNLPHVFLVYKNNNYDCPFPKSDNPIRISISQRLFFEIRLTMLSHQVEVHPVTCVATPDQDPYNSNNFQMMENGCIRDDTLQLEESDSGKISRFSVQAFRFVGFYTKIYVHCELIVCTLGSASSVRCPYQCDVESRRRRNAQNDTLTQRIQISTGPIIFVPDSEEGTPSGYIIREYPREESSNATDENEVENPGEIVVEDAGEEDGSEETDGGTIIVENTESTDNQGANNQVEINHQRSPAKQVAQNINTAGHGKGRGAASGYKLSFILFSMSLVPLVVRY